MHVHHYIAALSQEMVEAYKQQNRFLSSELAELNAVRDGDRELFKTLERCVPQVA